MAPLLTPESLAIVRDKIRQVFEPVEVTAHGRYTRKVKLPKEMAMEIRKIEKEALGGKARGAGGIVTFDTLEQLVEAGVLRRADRFYFWIYRSPLIMKEMDEREEERRAEAAEALLPKESRPKTPAEMKAR